MSKLIAFAAIQGGYKVVAQVEGELEKALQTYDAATKIGFPNTAYYLPVIYSLTGLKVETLEDLKKPMAFARGLLPPHIKLKNWLPYLGPLLDAGMAGIISYEVKEALSDDIKGAQDILARLERFGINVDEICQKLLKDGIILFENSFDSLLKSIENKIR